MLTKKCGLLIIAEKKIYRNTADSLFDAVNLEISSLLQLMYKTIIIIKRVVATDSVISVIKFNLDFGFTV